jgi:cell wall-associated NlpC family hydrolase
MTFDHRLFAFRPDLAEAALEGKVEAERFVTGERARISVPKTALRARPENAAAIETELLFGEEIIVLDRANGWAWGKSVLDDYVGYLSENALGSTEPTLTHWVVATRTFLYPEPDLKIPPIDTLSMGSRVAIVGEAETRGTRYLLTPEGAIIASHLAEIGQSPFTDHVAVAGRLIETPYLWGGRSTFGIDCSGLVQMSLMMTGKQVLRDADMQEQSIGEVIEAGDLRRGDLVFWKGHVAMMEDEHTIIHANGYTMNVSRERLAAAIHRIAPIYGMPRTYRRP